MQLIIIRHAEAHDVGERNIKRDEDRMLTKRGHRHAKRLGQALTALDIDLDALYSSPLVRARETAENLAESYPALAVETAPFLAPPGDLNGLLATLPIDSGKTVGIVAHEPFLGEWLQALLNGVSDPSIPLSKSSVACLELAKPPAETKLRWLLNKNLMKRILTKRT